MPELKTIDSDTLEFECDCGLIHEIKLTGNEYTITTTEKEKKEDGKKKESDKRPLEPDPRDEGTIFDRIAARTRRR